MIELGGLSVDFGEFALRGISLSIGKGEYWVILGPSGCGKSVLMQTIAGFFSPGRGQIRVDGRDVTALPPERRRMGLVFQQAALFPHSARTSPTACAPAGRRRRRSTRRSAISSSAWAWPRSSAARCPP
jgi:putative spermidine/putrescine transport system ATP-binding protein